MIRVDLPDAIYKVLKDTFHQVMEEGQHVILMFEGEKLAALIPTEDLDLLHAIEDETDSELVEESRIESSDEPPISLEALKKSLLD